MFNSRSSIEVAADGSMVISLHGDLHLHFHYGGDQVMAKLDQMDAKLTAIEGAIMAVSPQLKALTDEVTRANTVSASVVALIQGLAAQIEDLKDDPVALQALADSLKTSDDVMDAAVRANTQPPGGPTGATGGTGATGPTGGVQPV